MPLPGLKINALYGSSLLIFIARFFPSLANLVVMIWFSRTLTREVYGHYQNFWLQLLMLSTVICFGIHVLLVTYSRDQVAALWHKFKVRHYLIFLVWTIAFSAVFVSLQRHNLDIGAWLSFLFIFFYALTFIFESLLIVSGNFSIMIGVSLLYSVVFCVLHWYFMKGHISFLQLFLYLLVVTVVRFVIYVVVTVNQFWVHIKNAPAELPETKKITGLWLHLGLYDVLQMLFSYIDKFTVSLLLSAQVSAIYYNGSQNIPFLPLLLNAAGSAVLQLLAGKKDAEEHAEAVKLLNQSGRALSCVVFPVFFFLLFFRNELILVCFGENYREAVPVFLMALLVLPVRAYNFTAILQRFHKGWAINAGAIGDLVLACALMYPLFRWIGLPGIALAFVISTYLQALFYLGYAGRLLQTAPYKLVPLTNWAIKLIVFGLLFIGIHYIVGLFFTGVIALTLGATVLLIAILAALYWEIKKQDKYVYSG